MSANHNNPDFIVIILGICNRNNTYYKKENANNALTRRSHKKVFGDLNNQLNTMKIIFIGKI